MDYCPTIGRDPEVPIVQETEDYAEPDIEDESKEGEDGTYRSADPDYIKQLGMDGFRTEMLEEEKPEAVADGGKTYEQAFDYLGSSEIPLGEFGDGN